MSHNQTTKNRKRTFAIIIVRLNKKQNKIQVDRSFPYYDTPLIFQVATIEMSNFIF